MTIDKDYRDALHELRGLVRKALAVKNKTAFDYTTTVETENCGRKLDLAVRATTKDFSCETHRGKGRAIEISGLEIHGNFYTPLHAIRSVARTFHVAVSAQLYGVKVTAYPRSTAREIYLECLYRCAQKKHPDLER